MPAGETEAVQRSGRQIFLILLVAAIFIFPILSKFTGLTGRLNEQWNMFHSTFETCRMEFTSGETNHILEESELETLTRDELPTMFRMHHLFVFDENDVHKVVQVACAHLRPQTQGLQLRFQCASRFGWQKENRVQNVCAAN